jgi:hypothetical protein
MFVLLSLVEIRVRLFLKECVQLFLGAKLAAVLRKRTAEEFAD